MASAPIHAFQEFFFSSTVSATDCFPIEPSSRQWTVVREERIFAEAEIELASRCFICPSICPSVYL